MGGGRGAGEHRWRGVGRRERLGHDVDRCNYSYNSDNVIISINNLVCPTIRVVIC